MKINSKIHNTLDSLSAVYKLSPSTLKGLLVAAELINKDESKIFHHKKVMKIVEYLGSPDLIENKLDPIKYNNIGKLAAYFNVSRETFNRWIEPIEGLKIDNPKRRYYIPREVALIIDHIGV